jgi:uncharacterized protein YndB with AHSA1/START domain
MKLVGTLHQLGDGRGEVRVEDVYATDVDDLWDACTDPGRLARWIAVVSGDLAVGGAFSARFTSGWEGSGRVEVCERPHRLLVTTWEDDEPAQQSSIEVTLTPEREGTRLVVTESGVPVDQLPAYGAGWQVHAEDLAAHVAGRDRDEDAARWTATVGAYEQAVRG